MKEFDRDEIEKGLREYRRQARTLIENAGYQGSMNDGGGGNMLKVAQAYTAGLNKMVPDWLQTAIDYQSGIDDEERKEYQRLKEKFG